jgi:hypothetical protein
LIGERGAVSFAAKRGEAGVFCPCRTIPEFSEEARKEFLVGVESSAPSTLGPTAAATSEGIAGRGDAAGRSASTALMARETACASTAAGSAARYRALPRQR